jgi:hypothetical protein
MGKLYESAGRIEEDEEEEKVDDGGERISLRGQEG